MRVVVAIFCGVLFGIGLTISDMINPARVLGFLDLAGNWDPSAAFVFAGALIPSAIAYGISRSRASPVFDDHYHMPPKTKIDRPLVIGSVLFGLGWGISGFCPGPALAALSSGTGSIVLFVAAMAGGFALYRFLPSPA